MSKANAMKSDDGDAPTLDCMAWEGLASMSCLGWDLNSEKPSGTFQEK